MSHRQINSLFRISTVTKGKDIASSKIKTENAVLKLCICLLFSLLLLLFIVFTMLFWFEKKFPCLAVLLFTQTHSSRSLSKKSL